MTCEVRHGGLHQRLGAVRGGARVWQAGLVYMYLYFSFIFNSVLINQFFFNSWSRHSCCMAVPTPATHSPELRGERGGAAAWPNWATVASNKSTNCENVDVL
jgi:hypothetical protein